MASPYPKADNQRVGRQKPAHEWVNLPKSGNPNPVPYMPIRNDDDVWSGNAERLWSELWHSPQSLMWEGTTYHTVERYLYLMERLWDGRADGPTINGLAQCEAKLGLEPKAMMNYRWRIVDDHLADESFGGKETTVPLASVKPIERKRRDLDY